MNQVLRKSIIFMVVIFTLIALVFVFTQPAETSANDDANVIYAEASVLEFKEKETNREETVDIHKLYDDLYNMYNLRIYSAHTDIPLYFQSDYNHVDFAGGTIATSGCGITCLAMVSTYLLDEVLLPDEMARRYDCGSNPAAAMVKGIKNLGLNCQTYYGDAIHEHVWDAIENGQPVIALMRKKSLFTNGGHFVVIAGMTDDGKYIVNDPSGKNYTKYSLMDGYQNGFTKKEISTGLTGVYIFDKKEGTGAQKSVLSVYSDVVRKAAS